MFCSSEIVELEDLQLLEPALKVRTQPSSWDLSDDFNKTLEYKVAKEQMVDDFTIGTSKRLLTETAGNVSQGAEISGLSRTALQRIMRRYSIDASAYRPKDN